MSVDQPIRFGPDEAEVAVLADFDQPVAGGVEEDDVADERQQHEADEAGAAGS